MTAGPRRRAPLIAAASAPLLLIVTAALAVTTLHHDGPAGPAVPPSRTLFRDGFATANGANHLITNAWAFHHPGEPGAVVSPDWEMTSGSLFSIDGQGWTGLPDTIAPDPTSTEGTGSSVFRLRTRRSDFGDVRVDVDVRVNRWVAGSAGEGRAPDVVVWMRYGSEFSLYWPSVLRGDGQVDVEKKVPVATAPGCPDAHPNCYNGGDYYILPPFTVRGWPVVLGRWYHITVTAQNRAGGAVTIATYRDGRLMEEAIDRGPGQTVRGAGDGDPHPNPSAAITAPGRLGIRSDNAKLDVANYVVSSR